MERLRLLVALLGAACAAYVALKQRENNRGLKRKVAIDFPKDKPFVVFLIGASLNDPLSVLFSSRVRWFVTTMPTMMKELAGEKDLGLMHSETYAPGLLGVLSGRSTVLIQYWESKEKLLAFANSVRNTHQPRWAKYKQLFYSNEDHSVGIWHETYEVKPGGAEGIRAFMSPSFAEAAFGSVPIEDTQKGLKTARARLKWGEGKVSTE